MSNRGKFFLGIHTGHDRGASIVENGRLIAHIPEDRLDRIKHSESQELPFKAINSVLNIVQKSLKDIYAIGISCVNRSSNEYLEFYKESILIEFDTKIPPIFLVSHHVCHALACNLIIPSDENFIYVYDGAGDLMDGGMESETLFKITPDNEEVLHRRLQDYHESFENKSQFFYSEFMYDEYKSKQISLGKKYNQVTFRIGFDHFQDGKTMGLAPFGQLLFDTYSVASKSLDFSLQMDDILKEFENFRLKKELSIVEFDANFKRDMAATIQDYLEKSLVGIGQDISRRFGIKKLGLVGGVTLNCVANYNLLKSGLFDKLYPFPAAGDDGQSIGAALAAMRRSGINTKSSNFSTYMGPSYGHQQIIELLKEYKLTYSILNDSKLIKLICEKISDGQVVGLVRGRSEIGPRALGHRSILASASHPKMKDILNLKVKLRESFRPYAPMVLESKAHTFFDLDVESPFMLYACPVRQEHQSNLPSITHIDGTARVQTVSDKNEPFLAQLLLEMEVQTNYPILLNTSFNLAGEPIVESPRDAVLTFLRTKIDLLILENIVVERSSNQV